MSPEIKERIARVVAEIWRAASQPGAQRDNAARARVQTYAEGMLETVVQGEIERRIGELGLH